MSAAKDLSRNEPKRGRKPIGGEPMTPAERKRRSRAAAREGTSLESTTAEIIHKMAAETGLSERMARYYEEVYDNGIPEWIEYYRIHRGGEHLPIKRAAICARYLDEERQRQFLKCLDEHGLRFTTALYSELWRRTDPGSFRDTE